MPEPLHDKYLLPENERDYDTELGEYVPAFRDLWNAVAIACPDFDCNQIAYALSRGWSAEQTIAEISADDAHKKAEIRADFERDFPFDMSMNG